MNQAAGTGVDITIKGKPYVVYPNTMGDLTEFEAYVKSQKIKLLNAVEDKQIQEKMIYAILSKDLPVKELEKEMKKPKGLMFLLWKALRNDMTLADVNDLIDTDNLDEISNIVVGLAGVTEKK